MGSAAFRKEIDIKTTMIILETEEKARATALHFLKGIELCVKKSNQLISADHSQQVIYFSFEAIQKGFGSKTCGVDLDRLVVWGWNALPEDMQEALLACIISKKGERIDRGFYINGSYWFERVKITEKENDVCSNETA